MKIRIIITGASGFVGEGVLLKCLSHPDVEEVLAVNRRHVDLKHPKLRELIVPDFLQVEKFPEELSGYNACFYCAGISSIGLKEKEYTVVTYDTTMRFAKTLIHLNPDMVFNFISGSHTDGSEKGRIMWARVKGKTENALAGLGFKKEHNFRPGGMIASPGQKNAKNAYRFIVRIIAFLSPKRVCTLGEVALAMIGTVLENYPKQILEIADIKELAVQTVQRHGSNIT